MPRGYRPDSVEDHRRRQLAGLAQELHVTKAQLELHKLRVRQLEAKLAQKEALLSALPEKDRQLIIMVRPSPPHHDKPEERPATPAEVAAHLERYWRMTREGRSCQLAAPG